MPARRAGSGDSTILEATMVETLTRNWGWVALRGFAAVVFGLLTLVNPGITLAALVASFGAYAFVDGVFTMFAALANRHGEPRWVALFFAGVLGLAAGALTFLLPAVTAVALLAIVASWAVLMGAAEILAAIRLRREIAGERLFVLAGLLAIAFGSILLVDPAAGAVAEAMLIGAWAVVSGIVLLALGYELRRWGRDHPVSALQHPA
jgi:uncharacterized membrane protein HdeD (DUF308 family)